MNLKRMIIMEDGREVSLTNTEASDWNFMKKLCECELFDLVRLPDDWIMLVDDEGLVHGVKGVNAKATALYRSVCRPGYQDGIIVGAVAIVKDGDFE